MENRLLYLGTVTSFLLTIAVTLAHPRLAYLDCINSNECGKLECCVIGKYRFSIPTCKPMGEMRDGCVPDNEPRSLNVTYPDNAQVSFDNIYYTICPCSIGLVCSRESQMCIDPTAHESFNDLDYI